MQDLAVSFISFVVCYVIFGVMVKFLLFLFAMLQAAKHGISFTDVSIKVERLVNRRRALGIKRHRLENYLGWPFVFVTVFRSIYYKRLLVDQTFLEDEQALDKKEAKTKQV
jgi:hypothetical protein